MDRCLVTVSPILAVQTLTAVNGTHIVSALIRAPHLRRYLMTIIEHQSTTLKLNSFLIMNCKYEHLGVLLFFCFFLNKV